MANRPLIELVRELAPVCDDQTLATLRIFDFSEDFAFLAEILENRLDDETAMPECVEIV